MQILTKTQFEQLVSNGAENADRMLSGRPEADHTPVVKLFMSDGTAIWLLSELDPEDLDVAFGLCDLGVGFPELGSVRLSELAALRGHLGLHVERDLHFVATTRLSDYAAKARVEGRILA